MGLYLQEAGHELILLTRKYVEYYILQVLQGNSIKLLINIIQGQEDILIFTYERLEFLFHNSNVLLLV